MKLAAENDARPVASGIEGMRWVVGDDRVRGIENDLGRAEVLFEPDGLRAPALGEVEDVDPSRGCSKTCFIVCFCN